MKYSLACTMVARDEVRALGGELFRRGKGKGAWKESIVWRLRVFLKSNENSNES